MDSVDVLDTALILHERVELGSCHNIHPFVEVVSFTQTKQSPAVEVSLELDPTVVQMQDFLGAELLGQLILVVKQMQVLLRNVACFLFTEVKRFLLGSR